ncbi:MAG TPA: hypothetical protein VM121_01075 [Acidimicrobiales bacterium]|nr:hypothetical protein [Acidimicrobiales bacterium]
MHVEGGDGFETIVVALDGTTEVATWPLDLVARPDLSTVESLARMQLAARRIGLCVQVRHPSEELCRLLEFSGLRELLLEARRQTERSEQLRVDEMVEPGDPTR